MIFFVAVLVALGALGWTILVRGKDIPEAPPLSPTAHLEERKAQIYENLRDLQFEFRVGKLSDADYQKTKVDLQRELARVLAEIAAKQPGVQVPLRAGVAAAHRKPKADGKTCPHCNAKFDQPMKFCGECGKAMA